MKIANDIVNIIREEPSACIQFLCLHERKGEDGKVDRGEGYGQDRECIYTMKNVGNKDDHV